MEAYTEIFCWGGDHFGQLGLGENKTGKTYSIPRFCSFNILIRKVSCGEEHAGFISEAGHVYTMGNNSEGRLGLNDRSLYQTSSPCLVESLLPYRASDLSCGWAHTIVATDTGLAFSWGLGEFGALGTGRTESQWLPVKLRVSSRVLQVSAGARHSGFLLEEALRRPYTCGSGEAGQLGTGRRERELSPVPVSLSEDVKQVACGVFHTLFLTSGGRVLASGGNSFGQLGTANKKSTSAPVFVSGLESVSIEKVACSSHSVALSERGDLYIWGSGAFGEFVRPEKIATGGLDISVGGSFGLGINRNHEIIAWGANSNGELGQGDYEKYSGVVPVTALQGRKVNKVACGGNFSLCLGSDVPATGSNSRFSRVSEGEIADESFYRRTNDSFDWRNQESIARKTEDTAGRQFTFDGRSFEEQEAFRRKADLQRRNDYEEAAKRTVDRMNNFRTSEEDFRERRRENEPLRKKEEDFRTRRENELRKRRDEDFRRQEEDLRIRQEEAIKRLEDEEVLRRKQEDELFRRKQEEEAFRRKQEDEAFKRKQEDEAFRRRLEEEEIRRKHEEDAFRRKLEEEEFRRKQEESIRRSQEESFIRKQEDLRRRQEEEAFRRKQEEEAFLRKQEEEAIIRKQEEEAFRRKEEMLRKRAEEEAEIQRRSEEVYSKLRRTQEELEYLQHKFDQQTTTIRDLESQLAGAISNKRTLAEETNALGRRERELQMEVDKEKSLVRQLEVVCENLRAEKSAGEEEKQRQVNSYSRELDKLKTLLNQLEISCETLRTEKEALEEEKYRQHTHLSREIEMLNSNVSQLERTCENLRDENITLDEDKKRSVSNFKKENADLKHQLELLRSKNIETTAMCDISNNEIAKFKHLLEEMSTEKDKIYAENLNLNESNRKLIRKVEDVQYSSQLEISQKLKEFEDHNVQLNESYSQQVNSAERRCQHLEEQIHEMQSSYEQKLRNLEDSLRNTKSHAEQTENRNSECEKMLRDSEIKLSGANSQIQSLSSKLENERNSNIKLQNSSNDALILREDMHRLERENTNLRGSIEEITHNFDNLKRENMLQLQKSGYASREMNDTLEQLKLENKQLHEDVAELEAKNRQLFDNLQRELAQRAREYKERTMTMLNTPIRASPYGKSSHNPATPPPKVQVQTPGGTASGLLNVLHQHSPRYLSSPSRESPTRRPY